VYVPIKDDRYFTLGVDSNLFESTSLYEANEYEGMYRLTISHMPAIFSINLRHEISQFVISVPPAFDITMHEVIDVACYYYADWDSPVIATDDFIDQQVVHSLREGLLVAGIPPLMVEREVDRQVEMLSETLKNFIGMIIGILTRCDVPAIVDFGSAYRLERIDECGNVFFKITPPEVVYQAIEDNIHATRAATQQHKELFGG
jgi:hypothetical protein